jgi:uncharacterized membrane protein
VAQKFGKAGHGAREMAFRRELMVAGIAGGMLLLLWLWSQNMAAMAKLGLPAVVVLVVVFRVAMGGLEKKGRHLKKRARDAERGARAEEKVEERLAALPEGYASFHDLAFPGFNVDHVVVGPAGVFVVETKSHAGKVTSEGDRLLLNGRPPEKDFVNQTWSQTYHIRDLLKGRLGKEVQVKPVLCFSRAFVQVRGTVKGVAVVNGGYLNTFIGKQKPVLGAEDVARVVAGLKMTTKVDDPEKRHCPQCGADLVLRQFQSGAKAGEFFYGCLTCRKGWPVKGN